SSTNKNTNERTAIREHDNEGQEQEINEVLIKNKFSKKTKTSTNQHEVD
ncbi:6713_t:CDS:1, partial [Rhizophagus irregularis]